MGFLLTFVLLMIWWSSNSIESDLKRLHAQVQQLQQDTEDLNKQLKTTESLLPYSQTSADAPSVQRVHMQEFYPNLLSEDSYVTTILPQKLGVHFKPHGIRREAMLGHPDNLHPFNGFKDVSTFHSMCTPSVAQLHCGKFETLAPDLAIKIEEREREDLPGAHEYWIHLRKGVMWHPLEARHLPANLKLHAHFLHTHPVTAHDFKFFF